MGDAAPAYQGRLTRYRPHVVLVKKSPAPVIVLLDDLEAAGPKAYQFMLHALVPFWIDERHGWLATQQPEAGVEVKYLAPGPVAFRQWDGYDAAPTKPVPNRWHVEASTRSTGPGLAVLTVIVPYRGRSAPTWEARRVDTAEAVGVRIALDGRPFAVASRRHEVAGTAEWDGARFEGPVLVTAE